MLLASSLRGGVPSSINFMRDTISGVTVYASQTGSQSYSIVFPDARGDVGDVLMRSSSSQLSWTSDTITNTDFWFLSDTKSTGTNGGSNTAGSWAGRELNTIVSPKGRAFVQLAVAPASTNQILVQPGEYSFEAFIPFYNVNGVATRLQDVTNGVTLINGLSVRADGDSDFGGNISNSSVILGDIVIVSPTVLEVQYFCYGSSPIGLGRATGIPGKQEVYTIVRIFNV